MAKATVSARGKGRIVPRRALHGSEFASSGTDVVTVRGKDEHSSLPAPSYPVFLDGGLTDRFPSATHHLGDISRQQHADLGVYRHLQDSVPLVIEHALKTPRSHLVPGAISNRGQTAVPVEQILYSILQEVTSNINDINTSGVRTTHTPKGASAVRVFCCNAECPRFLHMDAMRNTLNHPAKGTFTGAGTSTGTSSSSAEAHDGHSMHQPAQQLEAVLLAATASVSASTAKAEGSCDAGGGYHVQGVETCTLNMLLPDFLECVQTWHNSRVQLQVDLFDFAFPLHQVDASSAVVHTSPVSCPPVAASMAAAHLCVTPSSSCSGTGTGATCSSVDSGTCIWPSPGAAVRLQAALEPLWQWLITGFLGPYFHAHGAPCPFAAGQLGLDWCSHSTFEPARYELQDRLVLQVAGSRRALLLPPSAAFQGLAPLPARHAYDRYSAPLLAATARPPPLAGHGSAAASGGNNGVALAAVLHMWPDLLKVQGQVSVLQPGDVLFIPAGWFLHWEALPDTSTASATAPTARPSTCKGPTTAGGGNSLPAGNELVAATAAASGTHGNVALVMRLAPSALPCVPPADCLQLQLSRLVESWVEAETGVAGVRQFLLQLAGHLEQCSLAAPAASTRGSTAGVGMPNTVVNSSPGCSSSSSSSSSSAGAMSGPRWWDGWNSPWLGADHHAYDDAWANQMRPAPAVFDPAGNRGGGGGSHSSSGGANSGVGGDESSHEDGSDEGSRGLAVASKRIPNSSAGDSALRHAFDLRTREGYCRAKLAQMVVDQVANVVRCSLDCSAEAHTGRLMTGGGTPPVLADELYAGEAELDRHVVSFLRSLCIGRLVPTRWIDQTCSRDVRLLKAAWSAPVCFEDPRSAEEHQYPELFRLQAAQKELLPRRYLPARDARDGMLLVPAQAGASIPVLTAGRLGEEGSSTGRI